MSPNRSFLASPKYYFGDTSFDNLMKKRIYHVLLIASTYDAFMLEDDGRIDEQIFNEYVSLNLRYPPQFIIATSLKQAFEILRDESIDLIITMFNVEKTDTFDMAKTLKAKYPAKPIVVLTPFSREISLRVNLEDLSVIDYIFCWLGNADILLAIIKLIEDKMNVEHDVEEVGVQVMLLVEDSIRFYSSYLPNIYKIIFQQSKQFMSEGLNEHQMMLRMRGRPKILLATSYEEAVAFYTKYKENLLGIISDVSYMNGGKMDKEAGLKLATLVKADDPYMPMLLQSSEEKWKQRAKDHRVGFLLKSSKTLLHDLRNFIIEFFAFGDFVFRDPATGEEVARVSDMQSLQHKIFEIPDEPLRYHLSHNHFSKWLYARALFPIARTFKTITLDDFADLDETRRYLYDAIASYRLNKARGVIAQFYRERYDEYLTFTRIGEGSIGGKARGLAFLDSMIKRHEVFSQYDDVVVTIPRTVVISTDIFDEFMEENGLYDFALSGYPDKDILDRFVKARLPFRIHEDLYTFISFIRNPVAIRSSSLLEDSHYQPFAGIYSTYMIPNIRNDERGMMEMLSNAIKSVYASVFFHDSKAYMTATSNLIDEEKMAIVLQEVCGSMFDNRFYPTISGVARSINFYPVDPEKPEDGIANIALGLGKHIVDGGQTLRFSPRYPKKVLQLATVDMALRETQKTFYALDLKKESFHPAVEETVNLLQLELDSAERDGSLKYIASTHDFENNILRDGLHGRGRRALTFASVLKHNIFPLAGIIQNALAIGQAEMNNPVEIEFAANLNPAPGNPRVFALLQIRPIVSANDGLPEDIGKIPTEQVLITSNSSLGNGVVSDIHDFVYVRPGNFNAAMNGELALQVEKLNDEFLASGRNYILVGPGRWGSSDPWLGIPVKWPQISAARVIVESGLANYRIDPSQGTHFFQNLTSFGVGYFTINPYLKDGFYDIDWLDNQPAVFENDLIRHVRTNAPMIIKMDGKKSQGVIMKPVD
ncbi:MAG TPA: phosphoenolpyruvate synthase [Bacteroidales bacterium]|nr:MAG: phosphoenolpyruvate synthase [Bacteroidetes bacterium GWE2_42_24]HBZ66992.1 phosphoenolpyruvate synthase [Bacteroidales bacterium]